MSVRYTLRLVENGAEVWKRWTGDREEMLRDLAHTLPDLDISERQRLRFAIDAKDLMVEPMGVGIRERGVQVLTDDLRSALSLTVRITGQA